MWEKVQSEAMTQETIVQRIRESLRRLNNVPERATEPYSDTTRSVQEAIRRLSRARVSDILRQLRAAQGLSYLDVQMETGLSQQLLFDVEFKDRRLQIDELRRLASCYQVSVNDILGVIVDEE